MRIRRIAARILVIALLVTLYSPTFIWLVRAWLANPYYGHGFLIPFVSAFLAWRKRAILKTAQPSAIGAIVFVPGLFAYVIAFIQGMQFLSAISLLIVLFGLILYFYGKKAALCMAFPVCFLIFMIPLPFADELAIWLQSFTAHYSAAIIKVIGIAVTTTGAEIYLPNAAFTIGAACSGMHSLISLLALAAIFGYIVKGHFAKRAILFGLAFPIALFANLVRVVSTLLIANRWGTEAAMSFFHDFSSILFFLVALLCLVLLSRLLKCKFGEKAK